MSGAPDSIVERLRGVLVQSPIVRLAILFGSRARDAAHRTSDVDVGFIPRDPDLPLSAELDLQSRLERAVGARVDLVRLDRASTILRWHAAVDSVALVAATPTEHSRFVAQAALEHADLMTTLGPAAERFRRSLAASQSPRP